MASAGSGRIVLTGASGRSVWNARRPSKEPWRLLRNGMASAVRAAMKRRHRAGIGMIAIADGIGVDAEIATAIVAM
jgi:hypothetical protein